MAKSFNMSSFKSQMRQAQHKAERQMRSEINKATRKFESDMNRELRKYNSKVRHNQQVITRELNKLQSSTTVRSTYTISLGAMHQNLRFRSCKRQTFQAKNRNFPTFSFYFLPLTSQVVQLLTVDL